MSRRPGYALAAVAAFLALLLVADRHVDAPGQLGLGALTWLALAAALWRISPERRAQTLVVVAVATVFEVIGSIVWGVYTYRLENLPSFVPPAHGLVYLAGVALARLAAARPRLLAWSAVVTVCAWGTAGVTVLPRHDLVGFLGALTLSGYILGARRTGVVFAGVFFVVAALELYGTALGTWTWAERAPGIPAFTQGNPPAGIAAGYVWFDICAVAAAPFLLRWARAVPRSRTRPGAPLPGTARSA